MTSISYFFLTFCLWLYFIHSAINLISILILCVVRLFILFISFHFCFFFLFCFAILYDFYCSFLCAHKRQVWVAQFIAHIRAERFVVFFLSLVLLPSYVLCPTIQANIFLHLEIVTAVYIVDVLCVTMTFGICKNAIWRQVCLEICVA